MLRTGAIEVGELAIGDGHTPQAWSAEQDVVAVPRDPRNAGRDFADRPDTAGRNVHRFDFAVGDHG